MVHFAHFRKVNVSAGLRSVTFLRAAGAKRRGPTFSDQWNLCSARRLSRAAAELGNRQSRMRPHGVMPGRLFATRPRHGKARRAMAALESATPTARGIPDSPAASLESWRAILARASVPAPRHPGHRLAAGVGRYLDRDDTDRSRKGSRSTTSHSQLLSARNWTAM
jgi:hypothetical protein